MTRRDWINLLILVSVVGASAWVWTHWTYSAEGERLRLGTVVGIRIETSGKHADTLLDSAFVYIGRLEKQFSNNIGGGEVWRINNAHAETVTVSTDLAEMLSLALKMYTQTDSLYNVGLGHVVDVWGFDREENFNGESGKTPVPPDSAALNAALRQSDFSRVRLNGNQLSLPPDMKLNLGSIAKGFIIDKTVAYLQAHGALSGYVNAGGNIRWFGDMPTQRVGIQHPRAGQNEVFAVLKLNSGSVATSGDYERYFEYKGVRYHHILDAKTGQPSRYNISATIVAPTGVQADILSTAVFLLPKEKWLPLLKNYPGCEAFVIRMAGDSLIVDKSPGMDRYLEKP